MDDKLTKMALDGAPYRVEIHVKGYAVRDVKGVILAVCRTREEAELIAEALMVVVAREVAKRAIEARSPGREA